MRPVRPFSWGHLERRCHGQLPDFTAQLSLEFLLGRQMQLVATGEDISLLLLAQGVLHHGIVLVRAKDHTQRRVVAFGSTLAVVVVHIELDLAEIAMSQLADLEIDEHIALEHRVIEDQVDIEMVAVDGDTLLARHECKTLAQFEQESLQVVDERLLQLGLDQPRGLRQAEELDDHRVFQHIERLHHFLAMRCQSHQALLVLAFCQTVVQQAGRLALELTHGPRVSDRFDFVEGTRFRPRHTQELAVVTP